MAKQRVVKQRLWQDWVNFVLGIWLVVTPFTGVGVTNSVAAWNSYVSGSIVAIFAIAAYVRPLLWEEWLNLIVGIWLVVAPFALHFANQNAPMWNQVVVGLLIAFDAVWAASQLPGRHKHA